eukprot:31231-Pelagococcus_subviridis.AAC.13
MTRLMDVRSGRPPSAGARNRSPRFATCNSSLAASLANLAAASTSASRPDVRAPIHEPYARNGSARRSRGSDARSNDDARSTSSA